MSEVLEPDRTEPAVVAAHGVSVDFKLPGRRVLHAVNDVSFELRRGETLGIIGESGCGKSTLARAVMGIEKMAAGTVIFDGVDARQVARKDRTKFTHRMQMVFQDPSEALDPHLTCRASVAEPLLVRGGMSKKEVDRAVDAALERVGLTSTHGDRRPRELSGGQRQRVNIARALTLDPEVLVCDEAVSALDVSVRAEILNLLLDLQADRNLAYLFISHDIGVVARICHRVGVMYLGSMVEMSDARSLVANPEHPYTAALISAEPQAKPSSLRTRQRIVLQGEMPSPLNPPSGCRFRTRCIYAQEVCATPPPTVTVGDGREVSCHFAGQLDLGSASHGTPVPVVDLSSQRREQG